MSNNKSKPAPNIKNKNTASTDLFSDCCQPSIEGLWGPIKQLHIQRTTFFNPHSFIICVLPPSPQKQTNKQQQQPISSHQMTEACLCPPETSVRPPLSVRAEALLSRFLLQVQAARSCTRMRRGMRRALSLVLELGRHRSRHCGIRG